MGEKTLADAIKGQSGWLIGLGVVAVILGVFSIVSPLITGIAVATLVGTLLLIGGIGQCIFAFRAGSFGAGLLAFVLGALTVVCGGIMIAHPILGLNFLTLLLIAYFIAEGICEVIVAFQVRPLSGWGWMVFSGIVSIVLGVLLWSGWPLTGDWAIGVLVGIKLIFLGTWMMTVGFAGKRVAAEFN